MTYRNRKILDLASNAPMCFHCGKYNDGTVVAAHSNSQSMGKGMGHKSHDWAIAYVCQRCHDEIDGRAEKLSRDERHAMWLIAHFKTMEWLFSTEAIVVK